VCLPPHRTALLAVALVMSCGRAAPPGRDQQADTATSGPAPSADTSQTALAAPTDTSKAESGPPADSAKRHPAPRPVSRPRPTEPMTSAAGTPDSEAPPQPLRDAYHSAPLDTVDARTYQGWKYFNLNCARCHGEDVSGTTIAPHLIMSLKPDGPIPDEPTFLQTVCGGRPEKGMPAWCTLGMTPAEIDTIYSYVKGRSDARLHPGRPARRGP
jgi:mono/diheme cytochrome c family protein